MPADVPADSSADGYLQRATLLAELGRYDEAATELGFALALDPSAVDTLIMLARVHLAAGRPAEALAAAESAVAAGPGRVPPLVVRGLALGDLERYAEAARTADEILALGPQDAYAQRSAAAILAGSRNGQPALNAAWHGVELAPEEPQAHLVLGLVAANMRMFDLAERAYREALRLDPRLAEATEDVGVLRLEQRRWSATLEQLAEAAVASMPSADPSNRDTTRNEPPRPDGPPEDPSRPEADRRPLDEPRPDSPWPGSSQGGVPGSGVSRDDGSGSGVSRDGVSGPGGAGSEPPAWPAGDRPADGHLTGSERSADRESPSAAGPYGVGGTGAGPFGAGGTGAGPFGAGGTGAGPFGAGGTGAGPFDPGHPGMGPVTDRAVPAALRQLVVWGTGWSVVSAVLVACTAATGPGFSRFIALLAALGGGIVVWRQASRLPGLTRTVLPVLRRTDRTLALAVYAACAAPALVLLYALFGTPWPLILAIGVGIAAQLAIISRPVA